MVIKAPRALRRSASVGIFGSTIEFEEAAPAVFCVAHDFVEGKDAVVIGKRRTRHRRLNRLAARQRGEGE